MMPRPDPRTYQRRLIRSLVQAALVCAIAPSATALTLAQCDRITHISHGGESDQTDLGDGRVMWIDWWSQEGTAEDVTIMECASGDALQFRTAETNMTRGRTPFDKTDAALGIIALHESGARAFATFDRIAADLERVARDIHQHQSTTESCACAALYPDMQNGKTPFDLEASTAPTSFLSKP